MSSITRMGWLLALGVIPLATFAADERSCNMRDAALPTNSITYVLCEQGLMLVTSDDGNTWAQRKIAGATGVLRAVAFLDVNRGLTVGDRGAILVTDDAGRTWTARPSGTTENLTDVQMLGDQGWITGYDGVILHTADGGKTWSPQKSGVALSLEALFFLDPQNGWAVGWAGTVLHTVDGGNKWQSLKIPGASWSLSSITFQDARNGWIVGFAGQLFRTKDGGATWEAKQTGFKGWLTSIGFDAAKRGWITTDEGFVLSVDGGETWKFQPTEDPVFLNKILRTTGTAWALGPFGMMKQTGVGEWKPIVNPLSPNAVPTSADSAK
ncbi:MAG: YCF48-related protein [Candidatus Solibacter sp.]|nr:YCF48-related protein [Candidatus Solibacter sp.]